MADVKFITTKDVCELFSVSRETVRKWTNSKILKKYKIGGSVFYRKDEVINALKPVENE